MHSHQLVPTTLRTIFNATNYVCMTFFCSCVTQFCAHTLVYICKQHGFMCIISSAAEMLSKLCICTAEPFKDFTTQTSAFAQLHTFLTHNCSIMIYIHSLTDLFIIRKPAWTPVICDNTGPHGRVCINVVYCQCCLKHWDPQFCNRFWNGKVISEAYLAAQMKWDNQWFTSSVVVHTVKLNLNYNKWKWFLFIHGVHPMHSKQQNQVSAFSLFQ